jgi:hypothetical protein
MVPGTGGDIFDLYEELAFHAEDLSVAQTLERFSSLVSYLPQIPYGATGRGRYYYLLRLNAVTGALTVQPFTKSQSTQASQAYLDAEKEVKTIPGLDAVLVSVDSLSALERAYPNYFADTRIFVELLSQALSGIEKQIIAPSLLSEEPSAPAIP